MHVTAELGEVAASSVRSYLNLKHPGTLYTNEKGRYALTGYQQPSIEAASTAFPFVNTGRSTLYTADCIS